MSWQRADVPQRQKSVSTAHRQIEQHSQVFVVLDEAEHPAELGPSSSVVVSKDGIAAVSTFSRLAFCLRNQSGQRA